MRLRTLLGFFAGGFSLEPETLTLVAAMSPTPDATRTLLINGVIKKLKTGGIWSILDGFYIYAANSQANALLNWVSPGTGNLVNTTAVTFTTDVGFTGATGHYLLDSRDISTLTHFTQNSNHLAVHGNGNNQGYEVRRPGAFNVHLRYDGGGGGATSQNWQATQFNGPVHSGTKHTIATRTSSTLVSYYYDGVFKSNGSIASVTPASDTLRWSWKSGSGASTTQNGGSIGAGLDSTKAAALYAAIQPYMSALGL